MKYCATCSLKAPDRATCMRTGAPISPTEDYCNHHTYTIYTCEQCGQLMTAVGTYIDHNSNKLLCAKCNDAYGTCPTCANGNACDFETNPSPLPKVVVQVVRQGPMTSQTQVKNPERIAITCATNCGCYNNGICCKEFRTCANWKE